MSTSPPEVLVAMPAELPEPELVEQFVMPLVEPLLVLPVLPVLLLAVPLPDRPAEHCALVPCPAELPLPLLLPEVCAAALLASMMPSARAVPTM